MNTKTVKVKSGFVAAVFDTKDGVACSFHRSIKAAKNAARRRGHSCSTAAHVEAGDEVEVLA